VDVDALPARIHADAIDQEAEPHVTRQSILPPER
jgi:hypothetical protein